MFDEFRMTMLRKLAGTGIDAEAMRQVMNVVDAIETEYDITRKETALVPLALTAQYILTEYLACKSLEGFSPATIYNYRVSLSRFLAAVKKQVEEIEPNDIRMYLYQYQNARNVSNRTLEKMRTTISGFFHWATDEGRIEHNPSAAIRPIRYVVKPKPSLSQIELEYVRKALGSARERAIIETLYSTGCRVSELCGMKKGDVDWDNGTVMVFGKGGKYRTVYLNAKAIVALRDYLGSRTDGGEHLFVSERRPYGPLKRAAVEKIVRQISDRAFKQTGVRVTPHVFRHTAITTALRNGMPIQNVATMVGHSELKTTMYYAKINTEDVKHDHSRYVI